MQPVGSSPLLGRSDDLRAVRACLDRVAAGSGTIAFVEGEAGIGKTRLLDEALGCGDASGPAVHRAAAEDLESGRPFAVVARALGCVPGARDARRARIAGLLSGEDEGPRMTSARLGPPEPGSGSRRR